MNEKTVLTEAEKKDIMDRFKRFRNKEPNVCLTAKDVEFLSEKYRFYAATNTVCKINKLYHDENGKPLYSSLTTNALVNKGIVAIFKRLMTVKI